MDTTAAPDRKDAVTDPLRAATAPVGPMRCARDPSVETYLRCGRCEKPICPRCLIQTPVGSRCRDCAQLRRLPMFEVRPLHYLKGLGAGVLGGVAAGWVMVTLQVNIRLFGLFALLTMVGLGYVIGEGMTRATGGKRGAWLAVIAALCVPIGVIGGWTLYFIFARSADPALALVAGVAQVFGGGLWSLIGLGFGATIAYYRVR